MKRMLKILASLSLCASTTTTVLACDPVQQFPSKSATVTDEVLNTLFENNKIKLAYFDYLTYINGFFEHVDFEGSLTVNKASSPIIAIDSEWTDSVKEYYDALSQIYEPVALENSLDFTGLTYVLENSFIDDFEIKNEVSITVTLNCTMAITVMKGWKTVGKLLLTVSNAQILSNLESTQFLNVWMSSVLNVLIEYDETNDCFIIKSDQKNLQEIINRLIIKNIQLKGLTLSPSSFKINEDRNEFIFNGFVYKLM